MKKGNMLLVTVIAMILAPLGISAATLNDSRELKDSEERAMLNEISYIEDKEDFDLGFDTYFYLPSGFNPYKGMELDINEIEFIECEEEVIL